MTRRPTRALRAAVAAGLVTALITGCNPLDRLAGPDDGPAAGPATTTPPAAPTPAPPAVPSADTVRATGTQVRADGAIVLLVLPVDGTQVRVDTQDDATVLTLDPGDPAAPIDVLIAAPAGATLAPQDDAGVVVHGPDGAFLGGAGRPLVGTGAPPVRLTAEADGALRLRGSGPATTRIGTQALLDADWGEREGGRSLAVRPSTWARTAGQAGEVATWTELVRAVPEADTQTMRDQLTCHALGAPDKATWNLEPWRPDVGLLMTLAASCNAT